MSDQSKVSIIDVLNDKSLKPKERTTRLGELLSSGALTADELVACAKTQKDSPRATLVEAIEYASKKEPKVVTNAAFDFVIGSLEDKAPRVKWESAKVIANSCQLFPGKLMRAIAPLIANTEHEGTVVRWSAAGALAKIVLCKTQLNTELVPALESLMEREEDNAIKKIYQQAIKKLKK